MKDLFGIEIEKNPTRGGGDSVYKIIGASNHCSESREEDDFYATPAVATEELCRLEGFRHDILEPCCGMGHISKVLVKHGYSVTSRDLVDRGFGDEHGIDFLKDERKWHGDIVTNPPYSLALQFVEHALDIVDEGCKVAMFLKLTFAEGKQRRSLFEKKHQFACGFLRLALNAERMACSGLGVPLPMPGGFGRRAMMAKQRLSGSTDKA